MDIVQREILYLNVNLLYFCAHIKMPCNSLSLSDTDNNNKIKVKELIGIGEPRILQNRQKKLMSK